MVRMQSAIFSALAAAEFAVPGASATGEAQASAAGPPRMMLSTCQKVVLTADFRVLFANRSIKWALVGEEPDLKGKQSECKTGFMCALLLLAYCQILKKESNPLESLEARKPSGKTYLQLQQQYFCHK